MPIRAEGDHTGIGLKKRKKWFQRSFGKGNLPVLRSRDKWLKNELESGMDSMLVNKPNKLTARELVRLLAKHDRAILRYIMTFLPARLDAEEVLQRTSVVLWEKLDEYDAEREFLPWALHRAYYEVLNFRKELARSKLVFSEEVIALLAEERKDQTAYLAEMKEALRECLTKVPPSDLRLLQCRYADSQTISDLAREFGRTTKSLYRRLDRVRAMLAGCVRRGLEARGSSDTLDNDDSDLLLLLLR